MNKEFTDRLNHLNDAIIYGISGNIAVAKMSDKWCILEYKNETLNYYFEDKNNSTLIFQDYVNQMVFKNHGEINWELMNWK